MNYYEVRFTYESPIEAEIIRDVLAGELGEIGFESFAEETDALLGYITDKQYDETALRERLSTLPLPDTRVAYSAKPVESRDWNEEWEKNYFKPIRVGERDCLIRASFHEPEPGYTYNIIIDPKMAFGTGNHETTYLMITELLGMELEGKELLDMGCGTAVLAILARMRGAKRVVAIDIDEWAYENALENIRLNQVEEIRMALGGAERIPEFGTFDVILANINRNILLNDIQRYAGSLRQGGTLLLSGFYTEDIPAIEAECARNGLRVVSHTERNNWTAVKAERV